MSINVEAVQCAKCGVQLPGASPYELPEERLPCPVCGSTARAYHVFMNAELKLRGGSQIKAKRGGEKKPFSESIDWPDFNRLLGKLVHRLRIIDRDNDKYYERITDYESGKVIHECDEPLSVHVGHGAARRKAKK